MSALFLFLLSLTFSFFFYEAELAKISFTNKCEFPVWPATLTGGGKPQLSTTGFELQMDGTELVDVPPPFTGRFWARTHCTFDSTETFKCNTGDCGSGKIGCDGAGGKPPVSLVEFTLAENQGQDYYDISLVDGFNIPLSVAPKGGSGNNCTPVECKGNVNSVCPNELALKNQNGNVIGCKSACEALQKPEYCCTGQFGSPETCPPTNYSMIFKNQCPQAYSYAYDDKTSTFSCTGGPDYDIVFCP